MSAVCPSGFQCDEKRCVPLDWRCDGHVDCEDHTDEIGCADCSDSELTGLAAISSKGAGRKAGAGIKSALAKVSLHCGEHRCMSASHICDGRLDCPWAQDERNCSELYTMMLALAFGRVFFLLAFRFRDGTRLPGC